MAQITYQDIYGPWEAVPSIIDEYPYAWDQSVYSWADLDGTVYVAPGVWDDWTLPWEVPFVGSAGRLVEVPPELRVHTVDELRIHVVDNESRITQVT